MSVVSLREDRRETLRVLVAAADRTHHLIGPLDEEEEILLFVLSRRS